MKPPSPRELWAAPELALVPPLLAAVDATLATLRAQHATLEDEYYPTDPNTLRAARVVAAELTRARAALLVYTRATRAVLHDEPEEQDPMPF